MTIAIMDGRARFDPDRAIVVEICESLVEAKETLMDLYPEYDYVVVNLETDEILFDPELSRHGL